MTSWIFLVLAVITAAQASNDWSKPCLSGVCSYDIPDSAGISSGSLKVWGSPDAISDITEAAGWSIIDCSPDKLAQDIRLVCNSDDDAIAAGCSHLEKGSGAVGKIVRLPENCGKNAFARVASAWIPDDQSIPESNATKVVRRDGNRPQVKALTLDTNFNATDPSKTGPINFAVQGANVKGATADIDISGMNSRRHNRIYGGENIERGLSNFVGDAIDSIKALDTFNQSGNTSSPFGVDKKFNILTAQLPCPLITASLTVDGEAKANGTVAIGFAASGTIFPPNVTDFAVTIKMNGDINGTVTMNATASGTLDSGKRTILNLPIPIPGLSFPGLLTIGPSFEVDAQASASLDLQADTTVGLNYHLDNVQLTFPPNNDQTNNGGNAFTIADTPLELSVSPSVQATGNVQAHLIPSLNFQVSLLDGFADVGIFLNLDASAEITLSLGAGAEASTIIDKKKRERSRTNGRSMRRDSIVSAEVPATISAASIAVQSSVSPSCSSSTTSSVSSALSPAASTLGDSPSFGGCINVDAGLSVNAGADGHIDGLFNANTNVPLFNKTFGIFQDCFGNQKRSLAAISSLTSTSLKKPATRLTCPAVGSLPIVKVIDQVVQATNITHKPSNSTKPVQVPSTRVA